MRIVAGMVGLLGALAAGQAVAADPAAVDMGRWDGAYSGVFLGWADRDVFGDPFLLGPVDGIRHPNAGAILGYRRQFDRFAFGLEVDIGTGGQSDPVSCVVGIFGCGANGAVAHTVFDSHMRATATLPVSERLAVFAAAGLAIAYQGGGAASHVRSTDGLSVYDVDFDDKPMFGYTVGGGVEYRPAGQWLLRGEVLYDVYDTTPPTQASSSASIPGCCAASATMSGKSFDFGDALTARVAVLYQYQ